MAREIDPDALWAAMRDSDTSPQELAEKIGATSRTILGWLDGGAEPRGAFLILTAQVLGVKPESLVKEEE